jgi:signal transduction histidine kinase/ActR/RegA family two-component response regulator
VGAIKGTPLLRDFQMPIGRGLSGRVAATGEPLFVEDPGADPENLFAEVDRAQGVATYLGLPVKTRDQVLGVLTFNTTTPHAYTPDELAYLGSFAAQAAIALEKAELLREEQSRRQQLEAVEAISAEMTRELDLPRVLDIIARRARELVGASACAVWLWSEAEAALSVQAWSGMGEEGHGVRIRLGEGVTGEAARRREGLIVNDYGSCPFAHPHFLAWAPHRAVLAEPLLYRDRLLGVIAMDHLDGERIFRTRDHHVLRLLAAHAAIAIENARLFAEVNRSYRELQRAQDELIRSEKLRALGQLAAGVAHDLNNILAAVLGQAQLLQLRIPDPEIQDALATLENAATDGAHIVRRLQDFARQRARSELVPMDLGAAVQEALEIARPRWRDEPQRHGHVIAITTTLRGLPAILGHPAEVREAVTNLILNAVDAMPQGGTLALSARRVPRETERATGPDPTAEAPATGIASVGAEWVELTIADTGTGMSEEVRQRIFEPFFTTKGARGSGLGLSVVYGIMERHGGRIALDSTQGQGTRLTLRFQAAGSPPAAPGKESPAASTPLRVLLVDDDAMVRETVGSLLRIMGHQTIEADGGAAGIARLAGSPVDVVMTDLGMPEVTGWEVARAAKAHDPSLPVILLTGWGDQILPESRSRDLVDRILGKPFRLEELKRAIAELHRTRSPIGPSE